MEDRWIQDPQGRDDVEKVSKFLKLPIWKGSALGDFRRFWAELWRKIDENAESLSNSNAGKLDKGDYEGTAQDLYNLIKNINVCKYQIGDIYITTNTSNPATIWQKTQWQKIEGVFLYATKNGEIAGATGGNESIILTIDNMPSHSHQFNGTTDTNGNHNHYAGNHRHRVDNHTHTQPAHTHVVTAYWGYAGNASLPSFAHGENNSLKSRTSNSAGGETTGGAAPWTDYQNPATSANGNHNHTINGTTNSVGGNKPINLLPPYYKVHVWKRIG